MEEQEQHTEPEKTDTTTEKSLGTKIKDYFSKKFRYDLTAGIIVGLVALPLAIAFAVASGASAQQGLYTAIIGGFLMALLSGSNFQVSGPTGAFIVILLGIVNHFGIEGLLVAGFLAGIILVLMGIFKFGSIIKYIPYPVIVGFTAGIGVIIFTGQLKDFFGLTFEHRPHGFIETITSVYHAFGTGFNKYAVIVGIVTILAYFIWQKFIKKFPAAPFALAAGIITSLFFTGIPTVGSIPSGLPEITFLNLHLNNIIMLLPSAFTIAMLGAIESLLSAVVADGMTGTKHNSNKELISQGIGNMVVPFFGGIPATGAIARTATNIKNGARTRIAGMIHAITLLLIVLILAPYASYIPMSALAAILMIIAFNMAEIPHFVKLLKAPKADTLVLITTFALTVFLDLTIAVGVGLILASLLFIKRVSEINITTLEDYRKNGFKGARKLHRKAIKTKNISYYEINGPLFFGAASILQDRIPHKKGEILILDLRHVYVIDTTAMRALEVILNKIHKNKGKVFLAGLNEQVRKELEEHGLIHTLGGADYLAVDAEEAYEKAKKLSKPSS